MTCPNCNSQYNDNLASCPFCSAQQAPAAPQQAPFTAPQQAPFEAPQGAFVAPPAPVKKKKKSALISIIIIAIFAIIGIIGAIGENKEQTHTFVMEEEEYGFVTSYEYEITHKGDTVTKIVYATVYEFDEDIYAEDEIEEFYQGYVDEQTELYEEYDFVDYDIEIDGLTITETVTFNDASDHVSDLVELDVMENDADFVSYEKTKENYEEVGFELVED